MPDAPELLRTNLRDLARLAEAVADLAEPLDQATTLLQQSLTAGGQMLCCGNGGSACDAAHFAAEIAGRYKIERRGFPALDLTADHSLLTALINDYPPQEVFARQVVAHGRPGDVLCAFTTSGNSENVRLALAAARDRGVRTVAFLGKGGGACRDLADVQLIVPHDTTARVQEMHLLLYHTICEALDPVLAQL